MLEPVMKMHPTLRDGPTRLLCGSIALVLEYEPHHNCFPPRLLLLSQSTLGLQCFDLFEQSVSIGSIASRPP